MLALPAQQAPDPALAALSLDQLRSRALAAPDWVAQRDIVIALSSRANVEAMQVAIDACLRFAAEPHGEVEACGFAAAVAQQYGAMALVRGDRPRDVIAVLEPVWDLRDRCGLRICDLAFTLADAYRLADDLAAADVTLDYFAQLVGSPRWQGWQESDNGRAMLAIAALKFECAKATLEMFLGNPDAVVARLRRARELVGAPPAFAGAAKDAFERIWRDAVLRYHLCRVDCHLGLENFAKAVVEARAARDFAVTNGFDPAACDFYLAMAESWVGGADAEPPPFLATLRDCAGHGSGAMARFAQTRLIELAAEREGIDAASQALATLRTNGTEDPNATTLATRILLDAAAPEARTPAALQAQKGAQLAALDEVLTAWARTPVRAGGVGFLHYFERREVIGQAIAVTLAAAPDTAAGRAAAVAEAFECVLRAQVHGSLARALGASVPSLADLQAQLLPDQGVVVFLPVRHGTHVFVATARALHHHLLAVSGMGMRATVQTFLDALREATEGIDGSAEAAKALAARLRQCGQTLADLLVPPALRADLEPLHQLTVVCGELLHGPIAGGADAGYLNYLPVDCLPWEDDRLWGQRFALDHAASLPAWSALRRRDLHFDQTSRLRLYGCLAPPGAQPVLALPEADRLSAWLDDVGVGFADRRQFVDMACTLASLAAPRAHGTIGVFVGHGGYNAANERGSFLQFVDGELDCARAEARDRAGLPLADLVVLAGCRLAKGPDRSGDSPANLGGAFLLGGATAVVQSRFALPLHRVRTLLVDLLAALAQGDSPAESLRRARAAANSDSDPLDVWRTGVLQVQGCGQGAARATGSRSAGSTYR